MNLKNLFVPGIILLLYNVGSIIFYIFIENWSILDTIYFMSSTISLVGLGDIYPKTDVGKIYTAIFAIMGNCATLILVSICVWKLSDILIDKYPWLSFLPKVDLKMNSNIVNDDDEVNILPSIKLLMCRTFTKLFCFLIVVILIFTVFFILAEQWNFIDSFYFSVCTITTLGYGDIVPITKGGKILFIICSLLGTCSLAKILSMVMNLISEYHLRKYLKNMKRNRVQISGKEYIENIIIHAPRDMNRRRLSEIFSEIPQNEAYAMTI